MRSNGSERPAQILTDRDGSRNVRVSRLLAFFRFGWKIGVAGKDQHRASLVRSADQFDNFPARSRKLDSPHLKPALHLRRIVGDAVMAVLPADHSIGRVDEFHEVLGQAAQLAEQGWLVTFGIQPTFPSTGYGYIQRAGQIADQKGRASFRVAKFAEKPRLEQATEFVASGQYYWNSGMFVWTVGTIMEQFRLHMPELHEILLEIDADWDNAEKREALFSRAPRVSIDFGVMEKAEKVATIPCTLDWNDVGNWRAVEDLLCEDKSGIAANTRYAQWESRDCLVHSASGKLVALVGVEDLIVVETPDVVLVCRKDKAEDVKQIVEELRRNGPPEYL